MAITALFKEEGKVQEQQTEKWYATTDRKLNILLDFFHSKFQLIQGIPVARQYSGTAAKWEIKLIKIDTLWATIQYNATYKVDIIKILV